jgi:hypothetical protein
MKKTLLLLAIIGCAVSMPVDGAPTSRHPAAGKNRTAPVTRTLPQHAGSSVKHAPRSPRPGMIGGPANPKNGSATLGGPAHPANNPAVKGTGMPHRP